MVSLLSSIGSGRCPETFGGILVRLALDRITEKLLERLERSGRLRVRAWYKVGGFGGSWARVELPAVGISWIGHDLQIVADVEVKSERV